MKPVLTWILVADGARARLFVNDGPGHGIRLIPDTELEGRNLPGRGIMSDRPGRTFDSVGAGRHAKEPRSDPREVEKQRFARKLSDLLDDELKRGRFDRLVLVAPPAELGRLRAALTPALHERVSAELNKDLTTVTPQEISEHLGAVMAV